jgi:phosphatidylinositol alpha-1,6-mannosyltransferase
MITRNFPPLVGGMERLNQKIHEILTKENNVTLLGPKGAEQFSGSNDVYEFPSSPVWAYLISSIIKALLLSKKQKYDMIFCGSGTAIIAGFFAAKLSSAKLICYLHGLDVVADNFFYQKIFVPLIKRADLLLVNSNHTKNLAIACRVSEEKIRLLHPGVMLASLDIPGDVMHNFREKFTIGKSPLIIIVGRLTRRKGIPEFIEHAMPSLVAICPDVKLLIIGGEATNTIGKGGNVSEKIRDIISRLKLENNIQSVGLLSEDDLNTAYFLANAMVFPVLDLPGDVEGFGMVAVEAAARGTPTVAFRSGGVEDAVLESQSGKLISPGNYSEMVNEIVSYIDHQDMREKVRIKCRQFSDRFSWDKFESKLNCFIQE